MIGRADIDLRSREWGVRLDIVEKDYTIGWLLWGIASDRVLSDSWVFKGGTCLKKCYVETYRFSEDLDFTVLPGGPIEPDDAETHIDRVLQQVEQRSGIQFSARQSVFRARPDGASVEGRVYYRGPLAKPTVGKVKIDLTAMEQVVRPPVLRPISHPFPDTLPPPAQARCYSLEELFAEKIRAMGERCRPRDLYDIVNLFRRQDFRGHGEIIADILAEKCHSKGVDVPSMSALEEDPRRAQLATEWSNMLSHQLPALPPLSSFLDELPDLFQWLGGTLVPDELNPIGAGASDDLAWAPPPTVATWGAGIPLETIRFAAVNRLCVDLGYKGSVRRVEPYSLRRATDGNLLLYCLRLPGRHTRSYRVDRIQSISVATQPFSPAFAIEFAANRPLVAPPVQRQRSASSSGRRYLVECTVCGRRFRRKTSSTRIRPHKNRSGGPCSGRRGRRI